jgi:hypothetical protein
MLDIVAPLAMPGAAMNGRRTTMNDIHRLEAAASSGASMASAALSCGLTRATVKYWARRQRIAFATVRRPAAGPLPMADAAAWRLREMMRQVTP